MERRYTSLRVIGSIYKTLGVIVLLVISLVVLVIVASSVLGLRSGLTPVSPLSFLGSFATLITALLVWFSGGLAGLGLYAFGEFILLMIAVEENTRATALYLKSSRGVDRPGASRQWLSGQNK